jgi:hypothetical protein
MPLLIALYTLASLTHFSHNAEFIALYPGLPTWMTRESVYLAWLGVASVGLLALAARLGTRGRCAFDGLWAAGYRWSVALHTGPVLATYPGHQPHHRGRGGAGLDARLCGGRQVQPVDSPRRQFGSAIVNITPSPLERFMLSMSRSSAALVLASLLAACGINGPVAKAEFTCNKYPSHDAKADCERREKDTKAAMRQEEQARESRQREAERADTARPKDLCFTRQSTGERVCPN